MNNTEASNLPLFVVLLPSPAPPPPFFFILAGWYEGNRLSDGQKGWFPVGNVIEITNEHVRRRNLRERYRVIQAASVVSFSNSKIRTTI